MFLRICSKSEFSSIFSCQMLGNRRNWIPFCPVDWQVRQLILKLQKTYRETWKIPAPVGTLLLTKISASSSVLEILEIFVDSDEIVQIFDFKGDYTDARDCWLHFEGKFNHFCPQEPGKNHNFRRAKNKRVSLFTFSPFKSNKMYCIWETLFSNN